MFDGVESTISWFFSANVSLSCSLIIMSFMKQNTRECENI